MNDIYVVATVRAAKASAVPLRAVFDALVEATRQEEGCLSYELFDGENDSFLFYEHWASKAALDTHSRSEHFLKALQDAKPLTDGAMKVNILKLY